MKFLIQIVILLALNIFLWRINEKDYNPKQFYEIVIIVSIIYGLYFAANVLLTFGASIAIIIEVISMNRGEFLQLGKMMFLFVEYFVILGLFIRYAYNHFEKRGKNIALTILMNCGITFLSIVLLAMMLLMIFR